MKTALALLSGFLMICVSMPIWFYLLYKLLAATQASDFMWFMFWAYMPATFLAGFVGQVIKAMGDDTK